MNDPTIRTPNIAVFCDFENVALGVRDEKYPDFDWSLVLTRLLDKGKIIVKRAYCDWERFKKAKKGLHGAGFELIEVPHLSQSGKNSADIRMVVDALDLCHQKGHVDIFVLVTGDSDFSPLVTKLRENNKVVIGLGVKNSTSNLLVESCDEFILYDDLVAASQRTASKRQNKAKGKDKKASGRDQALDWVVDTAEALLNDHDTVWGSMIKQALKRKRPQFSESAHGYRNFSEMLQDAQKRGLLNMEKDKRSGGYLINGIGPDA